MERKAIKFEFKADSDGRIEGYASRFNEIDQGGDSIVKGAYAKTLSGGRMPKMLWQHDMSQPIGVWEEAGEDETGLRVRGRLLDVQKGNEARKLIEAGAVDGLSIGYETVQADRGDKGERILKEIKLWEVSVVTFPMQTSAVIDAVKAAHMTERDMERWLTQDAKLTRTVARALMSGGFDAVKTMRDAGDDRLEELRKLLSARVQ